MATKNYYEGVTDVVYVSTNNNSSSCPKCKKQLERAGSQSLMDKGSNFTELINHYIRKHGYKLLHVGTETQYGVHEKGLWHDTVAVLGK